MSVVQEQKLNQIILYYETLKSSLHYYRNGIEQKQFIDNNYFDYTNKELIESFQDHLNELEKNVCFNIVNSVEASFRVDYINRVKKKLKDNTSRKLRELYKLKQEKASLEHDILTIWKQENINFKPIISNFEGTLKYRHWFAHGRYFEPKFGKNYDFETIISIAKRIFLDIPLQNT
jgi:hypothetical protein